MLVDSGRLGGPDYHRINQIFVILVCWLIKTGILRAAPYSGLFVQRFVYLSPQLLTVTMIRMLYALTNN